MSKSSDAALIKAYRDELRDARLQANAWMVSSERHRTCAMQAAREAEAWRERFDLLLSKLQAATVKR